MEVRAVDCQPDGNACQGFDGMITGVREDVEGCRLGHGLVVGYFWG